MRKDGVVDEGRAAAVAVVEDTLWRVVWDHSGGEAEGQGSKDVFGDV